MIKNSVAGPVEGAGWSARAARCLLPLLVGSLLAQVSWGQQFGPGQLLSGQTLGASSAIAADLDGDGDQDLLSASAADDKIAWYENTDGLGSFGPQRVITTAAAGAHWVIASDLDGDGDREVLFASYEYSTGESKVGWFENTDGLGTFGPEQVITGEISFQIFAADLDGDGDQDVLSASEPEIAWYENTDGLGSFGTQQIITSAADSARSVFATDLDGDGDQDVLGGSPGGQIAWYENTDGQGAFGPPQVVTSWAGYVTSLFAEDLDGDGDRDVLLGYIYQEWGWGGEFSELAWVENTDGLGTFGPPVIIATAEYWSEFESVLAADLDGDGDHDVLSAGSAAITWYENTDGLGTYGSPQVLTTAALWPESVFAADLDGDGDQDVLSASYGDSKVAWYENTDGLGTFGPQLVVTTAADGARSVFAADLDGDGDRDVLSATEHDDSVAWYENTDGLGTFGLLQVITTAADGASAVFAADLDGDGDPDVLSASSNDAEIAWYENTDGLGSFGTQQIITSAADSARSVFATDLDGDGDQDVLSAGGAVVAWYENTDGSGFFGPQLVVTTAAKGAMSVFAADLDGDGDRDVLSAGGSEIACYLNTDGLGAFGPQQIITSAAQGATSVTAADLDGDGDQDVLSASATDDKLAWYENTGNWWPFGAHHVITTSAGGASSIFAADLDGDGDPDVLSASFDDDEIAWFENTDGLGSFGPGEVIATAADGASAVFAADIDGDGDHDVLAASAHGDQIAWYENLPALLVADVDAISLSGGGAQQFALTAGGDDALRPYLLLGTQSGTSPGVAWDGLVLPLNRDDYWLFTLMNPNSRVLEDTLGILDSTGAASAALNLPPGLSPGLLGSELHHAYGVLDATSTPGSPFLSSVSNAVSLTLEP